MKKIKKLFLICITLNFCNILQGELTIPSPTELTFIDELGGSTNAKKMQDSEGNPWVVKEGGSPEHCFNEYQANRAYTALDVPVPTGEIFTITKGSKKKKTLLVNSWIKGTLLNQYLKKTSPEKALAVKSQLRKHFVVDCLLGNWDAIGMEFDNIIVDENDIPWRIDNGGALEYRSQGKKKGKEWGPKVKELSTLLDHEINPITAEIFENLSRDEILQQIEEIEQKQDELIEAVNDSIRPILKERLRYLIQYKYEFILNSI